jgi:hypothetical protein
LELRDRVEVEGSRLVAFVIEKCCCPSELSCVSIMVLKELVITERRNRVRLVERERNAKLTSNCMAEWRQKSRDQ